MKVVRWFNAICVTLLMVSGGLASEVEKAVLADGLTVPVIARADVLVVGSSLDGCFVAEEMADQEGRSVVLASPDTSLPSDLVICNRPWIPKTALEQAPESIRSFLTSHGDMGGDALQLNLYRLSEGLEDRIIDVGAALYYDLHPCGVQRTDRQVTAVGSRRHEPPGVW